MVTVVPSTGLLGNHWSAIGSSVFLGADTTFDLLPTVPGLVTERPNYDLLIEGVAVRIIDAAGGSFVITIGGVQPVQIGVLTAAADPGKAGLYTPLKIAFRVGVSDYDYLVRVTGTFGLGDFCVASLWGTFIPEYTTVPITGVSRYENVQPVSVEGYKWPLLRR